MRSQGNSTHARARCAPEVLCFVVGLLLTACVGWCAAEISPPSPPPQITLDPLDGRVRVAWAMQPDSLLTAAGLADSSLPEWTGVSTPVVGGSFAGLCDQDYQFEVRRSPMTTGRLMLSWYETPRGPESQSGEIEIFRADTAYAFAGGLSLSLTSSLTLAVAPGESVMTLIGAVPDTNWAYGGWNPGADPGGAVPFTSGLFIRGESGLLVFTAANSGTVYAGSTVPASLALNWYYTASDTDAVAAAGAVVVPRADTLVHITIDSIAPGAPPDTIPIPFFRVGLGEGTVAAGDSFVVWAEPASRPQDRVKVSGRTYEGFAIWKSEVIDLDIPMLREKMWRCGVDPDSLAFFASDPLEYFDDEVHNGYPYYYAVTVSDLPPDSTDTLSDSLWLALRQKVYPRRVDCDTTYAECTSQFDSADRVMVVPNPYKSFEEWEEGDPKIQFVNLPPSSTVYVYSGAGDFVISLPQTDPASDRVSWDLRSGAGEAVVSGIYIYKVESPRGEKIGRFIVIR